MSIKVGSKLMEELVDIFYPVGSLFYSSKSTSPENYFGGTWQQIKDTFILAAGDSYTAGTTGRRGNT